MEDLNFLRIFDLLVGAVGFAISIGVIFVPKVISRIEKKLNTNFSTDMLEKMLNQERNLSEALLKHPKIFGFILLVVSFFLILSGVMIF